MVIPPVRLLSGYINLELVASCSADSFTKSMELFEDGIGGESVAAQTKGLLVVMGDAVVDLGDMSRFLVVSVRFNAQMFGSLVDD